MPPTTALPALVALLVLAAPAPAGAQAGAGGAPPRAVVDPNARPATADPALALLEPLLARLRAGERVRVAGRDVVSRVAVPRLYEAAEWRLLWRDPRSLEALLAALADLEQDGLDPADYHLDTLAALAREPATRASPVRRAELDLLATDAFVVALHHLFYGKVDPVAIEPTWNVAARAPPDRGRVEYLLRAIATGRIEAAFAGARPDYPLYAQGRAALAEYRALAARGGWENVPAGPTLRPGDADPRVPVLRRRLAVTGDHPPPAGPTADSSVYDETLAAAVRGFQVRHQLAADGVVGRATLAALNVPVQARIDQIRVNLERARWVLHAVEDDDFVVVDVAGYGVRFLQGKRVVWQSRAIVGQPYRQTPVFRSRIDTIVFNPTWTVPPTILAEDVLPGMRRGENVLARKGLRVYDRRGREVDPATIDWQAYTARSFPYVLRQDAGDDNALGRVKILFPNPWFVYLHDTPTRALFERNERTFSSGCIRVEQPLELVRRLLADDAQWSAQAVQAAVDACRTRYVKLAKPVPVLLMYWTIDADAEGRLVFRRDVYGRDAKLRRALSAPFTLAGRERG
ncbi:MAG: murein L,D-transpeptidase [Pseudomonadota bacterium]